MSNDMSNEAPKGPGTNAAKKPLTRREFLLATAAGLGALATSRCAPRTVEPGAGAVATSKPTDKPTATATKPASPGVTPSTPTTLPTGDNKTKVPSETAVATKTATVTAIPTEALANCPQNVIDAAASMTPEQIVANAATPYFFTKPGEGATEEQAKKELVAHLAVAEDVLGRYLNTTTVQSTVKTVLVSPYLREQMASDYQDLLTVKNIVLKDFPEGAKPTMQLDGLAIVTSIWPKDGVIADLIERPKASPRIKDGAYWLNGTYKWMPTDQTNNPGYYTIPDSWDAHWVSVFSDKEKTISCGKALVRTDKDNKVWVFDPNKFVTGQEKTEQVWVTGVDIRDISTWPSDKQKYWEDVSKRPVNRRVSYDPNDYSNGDSTPTPTTEEQALIKEEQRLENLDVEFTDKFWSPATEAFLKKEGIDVDKFNFGRTLDRPTMLTWGLIKWQQDHVADYQAGKMTFNQFLLKIPPSVLRHLSQDTLNHTVSYQEKIEGTRQPKVHDGNLVKLALKLIGPDPALIDGAEDYMNEFNNSRMQFPIFGSDLTSTGWQRYFNLQCLGDLSGLFLLPGKDSTDQIGVLSGNEGQPEKGVGLLPLTISFNNRTENYTFINDQIKKLDQPITIKASRPYPWNSSEPWKIEGIIAGLGGKINVDTVPIKNEQNQSYNYTINSQFGLANADQFDIIYPDPKHPEITEAIAKGYSPINKPWESTTSPTVTPSPTPGK